MVQNLKWWNVTHTHTHKEHDHLTSLFFLGRNVKLQNYTNAQKKEDMLSEYVEIKCQLDATEVFIADLTACSTCFGHSGAQNMLSKQ